MKIYKQAVLIPKDHGYLEVISYFDMASGKYGLDLFQKDKLVERIEALDAEPTRDEMRFFGIKLTVKDTIGGNRNYINENNIMKSEG